MSITRPKTLILHFAAYLINYFYNSKNQVRPPKTDCIFEISIKKYVDEKEKEKIYAKINNQYVQL